MTQATPNAALDGALANLRRMLDDLAIAFPRIQRMREFPSPPAILRLADSIDERVTCVLEAVSLLRHEAHREMDRLKATE
jgi:hypothetical protein